MKLDSATSVYNMGDTSIRVKQVVEVNKIILQKLSEFMSNDATWERNSAFQENFYKSFLDEIVRLESVDGIELFEDFQRDKNYTPPNKGKIGMRGRTLTSPLVKIGVINSSRRLSLVGEKYLNSSLKKADKIEQLLELDIDNLLYFRQFLKLRIYDHNTDNYFYNYRFAIKFLSKYADVPQNDFLTLLESIRPTFSTEELESILSDYEQVYQNIISFDEFYTSTFTPYLVSSEMLEEAKTMFLNRNFSDEMFMKIFPNRDSKNTSLLYKDFVLTLIEIQESNPNDTIIRHLFELSRNAKIKKAFGAGKIPLDISRRDTINIFLEKNSNNPLLSANHFDKYIQFIFSKHKDLIREYADMGRRVFQVSGLIRFNNGLANLNNKWILSPLLDIINDRFILSGNEPYSVYEETDSSDWFNDITLIDIFSISEDEVDELFKRISDTFGIQDLSTISQWVEAQHEQEYRDFVETEFPRNKVIQVLNDIIHRNDNEVFKQVTDSATIPTIYEYILTIAWYHISSNKSFKLSKAFQVALDGNKLPLSHRGGGAGDIEIRSEDYSLLIEATLMDRNTQKRGELEPVIRHSTNFAVENFPKHTQTLFVANELDDNVLNIFRAMQFTQLNGTYDTSKSIHGLNIFALTTKEFIMLLEEEINDTTLLNKINSNLNTSLIPIQNNWREPIISDIFTV